LAEVIQFSTWTTVATMAAHVHAGAQEGTTYLKKSQIKIARNLDSMYKVHKY
jgi:hypothetical protein